LPVSGVSWPDPNDGADAWIIISQSCDLVRDVRDEPLVQLALLRHADPGGDLASWSRNSARWIPLDPKGSKSRYYVDLRVQAFVPKHVIAGLDVRHAVPADDDTGKPRAHPLRASRRPASQPQGHPDPPGRGSRRPAGGLHRRRQGHAAAPRHRLLGVAAGARCAARAYA
jgi:hypothetical protein